jgi:hypothetical protein
MSLERSGRGLFYCIISELVWKDWIMARKPSVKMGRGSNRTPPEHKSEALQLWQCILWELAQQRQQWTVADIVNKLALR